MGLRIRKQIVLEKAAQEDHLESTVVAEVLFDEILLCSDESWLVASLPEHS